MRAPSTVPSDYLARWQALAQWAVEARHGAACRFAVMYALAMRGTTSADSLHINYVRPRVWHVAAPKDVQSQRVSLFEDNLMRSLLTTIDATAGLHCPVFPRVPCGSQAADVWAHSMASRKQDLAKKNFAALSERFGIALNTWSPLEIYIAGLSTFRACFHWDRTHEGRDYRPTSWVLIHGECITPFPGLHSHEVCGRLLGELSIEDGDTLCNIDAECNDLTSDSGRELLLE